MTMSVAQILEYIKRNKREFLYFVAASIGILFFFTDVVKIELGHILAILVATSLLVIMATQSEESINDTNKELDYKLNSLLDDKPRPSHFYVDADMINIFYNIKEDLANYNIDAYNKAIFSANIVLKIRYDIEKKLCDSPRVPNILQNFTPFSGSVQEFIEDGPEQYDFKDDTVCDSVLENSYENFRVAEMYVDDTLNNLHSLIYSIPSSPVTHRKHQRVLERVHILLKRNLDIIKNRYDKSVSKGLTHKTKIITDYDLPKAFNTKRDKNMLFY